MFIAGIMRPCIYLLAMAISTLSHPAVLFIFSVCVNLITGQAAGSVPIQITRKTKYEFEPGFNAVVGR